MIATSTRAHKPDYPSWSCVLSRGRSLELLGVLICAAVSLAACGSRSLVSSQADGGFAADTRPTASDGTPQLDASTPRSDSALAGPCAPMDAVLVDPNVATCNNPNPVGWSWDGQTCVGISCACEGEDCDALYPSAALCLQDRAARCLPTPYCLAMSYEECETHPDCETLYYGGGCVDLDTCEPESPTGSGMLCRERDIACVPADHRCNERSRSDCNGECFWWEQTQELCWGGSETGDCCFSESYGYCASANACLLQGGFCLDGDYVQPTCPPGYGNDPQVIAKDPEGCGLGVCCTPCPDLADPRVEYISRDPLNCASLEFDCQELALQFDNECGCGCVRAD